jgi:hypothetical protein
LSNQPQSRLRDYFPQARELTGACLVTRCLHCGSTHAGAPGYKVRQPISSKVSAVGEAAANRFET